MSYFMSQKQMSESRWHKAVIESIMKRKGKVGYVTHTGQCGCGCGPLCHFVESNNANKG